MRPPRLLGTAAFRLALVYAGLFVAGALALIAYFDFTVWRYANSDVQQDVQTELRLLQKTAADGRAPTVARLVGQRQQVPGSAEFRYLVQDGHGRRLAGDLPARAARGGWGKVKVAAPADGRHWDTATAEVHTLGAVLPDGGLLVVGQSTYQFHELAESLMTASIVAGVLISLLSLGLAVLIGRQFAARIDRVNLAAQRIMDGRLEERLPAIGMGAEFDRLAGSLNAMLDRIQALMEGLRQVSSDIAHDMRTPLTRLRRRLEGVLDEEVDDAERQALAAEALAQLDEILATFGALLRIAQVEGGTGREAFRAVALSELMERMRQVYEPAAEDAGKQLRAEVEPGVMVSGDEELLTQLISNLVENAFNHAPDAGTVTLQVRADKARAMLCVADGGPGVPEAERAKVLRRFYRLDRSRTTPGAGLGLAMVQAVAQLHDGEVELLDNHPGLQARVWLPRLTAGQRTGSNTISRSEPGSILGRPPGGEFGSTSAPAT